MNCPRCNNYGDFRSVPRPSIAMGERYKCLHCGVILEVKVVYQHVYKPVGVGVKKKEEDEQPSD